MNEFEQRIAALEQHILHLERILTTESKTNESQPAFIPFDYSECKDGIKIDKYNGFDEPVIVVPEQIDGKPVVEICDRAFYFDFIKIIKLPETIKRIGSAAFLHPNQTERPVRPAPVNGVYGQVAPKMEMVETGLQKINLPPSVEEISDHAFATHSASLLRKSVRVYCYPGTYALRYAREKNLDFRPYQEFNLELEET